MTTRRVEWLAQALTGWCEAQTCTHERLAASHSTKVGWVLAVSQARGGGLEIQPGTRQTSRTLRLPQVVTHTFPKYSQPALRRSRPCQTSVLPFGTGFPKCPTHISPGRLVNSIDYWSHPRPTKAKPPQKSPGVCNLTRHPLLITLTMRQFGDILSLRIKSKVLISQSPSILRDVWQYLEIFEAVTTRGGVG